MMAAPRTRQLFYQARLLLDAARQPPDCLAAIAWQQTCYEAALGALVKVELSVLRELAEAYRLQPQQVYQAEDLACQARQRGQVLQALPLWQQAAEDPQQPLCQIKRALQALEQKGYVVSEWQAPEATNYTADGLIALHSVDSPPSPLDRLEVLYQQLKAQVEYLREGWRED